MTRRKPESLEGSKNHLTPEIPAKHQGFQETSSAFNEGTSGYETVEGSTSQLPGFDRRVAGLRARAGLTQDALSQRVSASLSAVKAWESGRSIPRLEQAVALADALGVSLDNLVHGGEEPALLAVPPAMDDVDVGSLVWALDFVEKQAPGPLSVEKRAELMLFTAAEFRRAQRIPPLPQMDADLLGRSLDLAEQLLQAAGAEATTIRRVGHMLANYGLMEAYRAGREP